MFLLTSIPSLWCVTHSLMATSIPMGHGKLFYIRRTETPQPNNKIHGMIDYVAGICFCATLHKNHSSFRSNR